MRGSQLEDQDPSWRIRLDERIPVGGSGSQLEDQVRLQVLVHFLSVNLEGSRPVCPLEGHLVTMVTVFTMGKSELCLKTTLDILMVHFEIFILK